VHFERLARRPRCGAWRTFHVPTHRIVDDLVSSVLSTGSAGRIDGSAMNFRACRARWPERGDGIARQKKMIPTVPPTTTAVGQAVDPVRPAVVSADHVVKDPNQNGHDMHSVGTQTEWHLRAAFLVENREHSHR